MPIDFHYALPSPPCRSVMLVAKALKVDLNLKVKDLAKGETRTPEFLKLNPQHAIPTIDDNGFGVGESRAILGYLVNKYGKDDSLYPKDPKKRAIVDQRLYFDIGSLYQGVMSHFLAPIFNTGSEGDKTSLEKLEGALEILDNILEGQTWVAGPNITIADYAIAVTVSTIDALGLDFSKYSNVAKWYARAQKTIEGYKEINEEGNIQLKELLKKFRK